MEPFRRYTAVAAPFDNIDVDTDQIIPTRFLLKPRADGDYGANLLSDLRYDHNGEEREGFVLNREPFRHAGILVANHNFGCGSSREQAVWACADFGFRAIIAPSFGNIFLANCAKLGIVPAIVDADAATHLREALLASPGATVTVDLVNKTVNGPGNVGASLQIEEYYRSRLIRGIDDISLSLVLSSGYRNVRARICRQVSLVSFGPRRRPGRYQVLNRSWRQSV